MKNLNEELDKLVCEGTIEHIAVRVGVGDTVLCDAFRGGVGENTLFDMASVTKIMATTSLACGYLRRFTGRCPEPHKPLKRLERNFY